MLTPRSFSLRWQEGKRGLTPHPFDVVNISVGKGASLVGRASVD